MSPRASRQEALIVTHDRSLEGFYGAILSRGLRVHRVRSIETAELLIRSPGSIGILVIDMRIQDREGSAKKALREAAKKRLSILAIVADPSQRRYLSARIAGIKDNRDVAFVDGFLSFLRGAMFLRRARNLSLLASGLT